MWRSAVFSTGPHTHTPHSEPLHKQTARRNEGIRGYGDAYHISHGRSVWIKSHSILEINTSKRPEFFFARMKEVILECSASFLMSPPPSMHRPQRRGGSVELAPTTTLLLPPNIHFLLLLIFKFWRISHEEKMRNFPRRWISGWCVIWRLLLTPSIIIIIIIVSSWMCSVCRQKLKNKMNHCLSIIITVIISSFCSSIFLRLVHREREFAATLPPSAVSCLRMPHIFDVQNVCASPTSWGVVRWNIA